MEATFCWEGCPLASIVIVGANRGIGYYLVRRLLELGHSVAALDVETGALEELRRQHPETLLPIAADARQEESIRAGVEKAVERFHGIDIAVHNACLCTFESEPDSSLEVYRAVMDVNFFGALRLTKAVLPYMRQAGAGRVIFTSSGVGVTGFANISPYASTKGAIESLAKCLTIENESFGITFHLFHPPLTDTDSARGLPVPRQFKADPQKVGYGLADHIWSKKFVICHSFPQAVQMKFSYRHPLYIGKLMTKMTTRAAAAGEKPSE